MKKMICQACWEQFSESESEEGNCPACGSKKTKEFSFANSETYLAEEVPRVLEARKRAGLDGLVGGLQAIIINTEPNLQKAAAEELLRYTGLSTAATFRDDHFATCVLKVDGSADFLVRSRLKDDNPFHSLNLDPKSKHLPDTRLETFIFKTPDIEKYVAIQKNQGVQFLTDGIIHKDNYSFIQTRPSRCTGNSLGFIQWHKNEGDYSSGDCSSLGWAPEKPRHSYLRNIGLLDHAATRLHARDRDAAIIEFLKLTNYHFDFAIYVKIFNSITSVARLSRDDYAMVFTSGISQYENDETSGPTEKFVHHYGRRVHHMAFVTEDIEDTVKALEDDGMTYLIELVGSPEEGLKQTFTNPSKNTLLVNEYIHRYGGYDGFFTRSNVTALTGATDKQVTAS